MDSAPRRNVINHAPTPAGLPVSQRIAERDKSRPYADALILIVCFAGKEVQNWLNLFAKV